MQTLWQDLRFGARMLARAPGLTLAAALTLGVGIGANTAVFSVVNSVLLRPLPVDRPQELLVLGVRHPENPRLHRMSYLDFEEYRAQSAILADAAGYVLSSVGLAEAARAERITAAFVTGNYFSFLGLQPAAGRLLQAREGSIPLADPVTVLDHRYWKRRFLGDTGVVGRVVRVNGRSVTIVGVAPDGFGGTTPMVEVDAYLPLGMAGIDEEYADLLTRRDAHELRVLARLGSRFTRETAQPALDVIASRLESQYPNTNKGVTAQLLPELRSRPELGVSDASPFVAATFVVLVGLLLLVACVNVANLLLVRAAARARELAVRAALGASRARLMRQLLVESLLLSALGGVSGLALGHAASLGLATVRLPNVPVRFDFAFDTRVYLYCLAAAISAAVAAGLLPALRASRPHIVESLRERGAEGAPGRRRLRDVLVAVQVGSCVVLLVAAGLFVRSLRASGEIDLGFQPARLVNLSLDVAQAGYDERRARAFYRELLERVRALPGVESATLAASVPMGDTYAVASVLREGETRAAGAPARTALYNAVEPAYFETFQIPLLQGRRFADADGPAAPRVAVVNQALARELWPGADPIGKRFSADVAGTPVLEVVGLTRTGKYHFIFEDPLPYFYVPSEQFYTARRTLHVRAASAPQAMAAQLEKRVQALAPELPVYDVQTMERALSGVTGFFLVRAAAFLAGLMGCIGLLLALVGVAGVVGLTAVQRTHEIGVRRALGARHTDIVRLVVGHGFVLVGAGAMCGLLAAAAVARLLGRLLYGVHPQDPLTFIAVPILLAGVAVLACAVPAWRAARVEPMAALRED